MIERFVLFKFVREWNDWTSEDKKCSRCTAIRNAWITRTTTTLQTRFDAIYKSPPISKARARARVSLWPTVFLPFHDWQYRIAIRKFRKREIASARVQTVCWTGTVRVVARDPDFHSCLKLSNFSIISLYNQSTCVQRECLLFATPLPARRKYFNDRALHRRRIRFKRKTWRNRPVVPSSTFSIPNDATLIYLPMENDRFDEFSLIEFNSFLRRGRNKNFFMQDRSKWRDWARILWNSNALDTI